MFGYLCSQFSLVMIIIIWTQRLFSIGSFKPLNSKIPIILHCHASVYCNFPGLDSTSRSEIISAAHNKIIVSCRPGNIWKENSCPARSMNFEQWNVQVQKEDPRKRFKTEEYLSTVINQVLFRFSSDTGWQFCIWLINLMSGVWNKAGC